MTTETAAAAPTTQTTGAAAPPPSIDPAPTAAPAAAPAATAAPATVEGAAPTTTEAPAAPPKAPEKYDFKSAEGKVAPDVLAKLDGVARELGMTQEQATKLLDSMAPAIAQAQQNQRQALSTQWAEQAKADPEFGGANLDANLGVAKQALATFGTPALVKMLDETGLGNHPEIIRAFVRAGQKIAAQPVVTGTKAPTGQASAAKTLYPNMS